MLNITHHDVFFLNPNGLSCLPSGKIHTPHFNTTNLGNAENKLTWSARDTSQAFGMVSGDFQTVLVVELVNKILASKKFSNSRLTMDVD